ncbi:YdcF family protein, partial [Corynebacterium sp. 11266D000AW]
MKPAAAQPSRSAGAPAWIAVLGTAQYDGVASRVLAARIATATQLAHAHPAAAVFTLGGNLPGDRFTEAGVAARDMVAGGIDSARVTALAEGNDTAGSLAALAREVSARGLGAGVI